MAGGEPAAAATGTAPGSTGSTAADSSESDAALEQLLADAWGLISRGDYDPGRNRLQKARKLSRTDIRADFGLGLLEGLIARDWPAAEKRFAECLARDPTNVAVLNNLAVAQIHNQRASGALKHWRMIVEMDAVCGEVVQNLGRVRHLLKQGELGKTTALVKGFDELYTKAAIAMSQSAKPQAGFRLMDLRLADGRMAGWPDARRLEDNSPAARSVAASHKSAAKNPAPAQPSAPRQPTPPQLPINAVGRPVQPMGAAQPLGPMQPGAAMPVGPGGSVPLR
jgi:tetratricopeptide (TPR) repeat protein